MSVILAGVLTMGFAIGIADMGKMVLQMAYTFQTLKSGPALGIFTAGLLFSFSNSWVCITLFTSKTMEEFPVS